MITSSNAVIIYKDNFFASAGMPLVKFSADQSITSDEVPVAETRMGVDGKMAAGYVPNIIPVTIMFEADSSSWRIIEQSLNAAKSLKTVVECEVVVTVPALAKSYTYKKGVIKSLTDLALKKTVDPVTLKMDFESKVPNFL